MKRLLLVFAALAFVVPPASARPEFWDLFQRTYSVRSDWPSFKAACLNCHTDPPSRNAYGKALQSAMKLSSTKVLTGSILKSVENQDADSDGWSNGIEILAGCLPGDPTSHPSGVPPMANMVQNGTMSHGHEENPLLPNHSFHPLIVHFPVALFLFGVFLDIWGAKARRPWIRQAALFNLVGGTAATAFSIPTGFLAAWRLGFAIGPGTPVFLHLSAAILATVLMILVVLQRRKEESTGFRYFALLILAAVFVGLAGHLGGALVYG